MEYGWGPPDPIEAIVTALFVFFVPAVLIALALAGLL
jgi:hypothetical protein